MSRSIDLAVKVTADADVSGLKSIGDAAGDMANKVDAGAADASRSLDLMSSSADNLDDKGGKASGALSALASGFELMGPKGEAAAAALGTAAQATDFLSGAGQALNLIMDLDIAKKVASTAATVGHSAATLAAAGASKIAAAGQWALNVALSANPIGAVIVLLVAIAAAVVIAYQKSETFRDVVDTAFKVAKNAIASTVDTVSDLVGWFREKVPPALEFVRDKVPPLLQIAFFPLLTTIDIIGKLIEFFRDRVPSAIENMKDRVVPFLEAVVAPIRNAYDAMSDLVDKIASIHFPSIPKFDLPFNGRSSTAGNYDASFGAGQPEPRSRTIINVVVNQTIGDPVAAAREIRAILARADRITG